MPIPFRPRLEALDARDLPAVTPFSFALSDGTLVSGSFDYSDAAVDSALTSQQVPISDLTVALNGQPAVLPGQLNAAMATFAQGQFEGVALTAVAVAGDVVAFIDTTGAFAPISVSTVPVVPITLPDGGVGPIDWTSAVESYNSSLSILNAVTSGPSILDGRSGPLQTLMNQHDYWLARRDDAVALAAGDLNPVWYAVYINYLEFALGEIRGVAIELSQVYSNYQTFHQNTVAQYQLLLSVLPPAQGATLTEPPEEFYIPDEYFEHLPDPV